jgi:hypothetical protein
VLVQPVHNKERQISPEITIFAKRGCAKVKGVFIEVTD